MTYQTYPSPAITWASFPGPCYDPQEKYGDCPKDLLSLLSDERIPAKDRIWAFASCTEVSDSAKRIFAVRCVRETPLPDGRKVVDLITDERSLNALDVAYKHAIGEASDEDLDVAWSVARSVARSAAWSAAWSAASDAAWSAASDAAWSAASDAAWSAAWSAESDAAWSAAWSAESDAAWSAALDAQIQIAKSILQ